MPYDSALPNQNKGYAKQEKKDLMNDMPIDKRASGGSFMSKHSQSKMGGSPVKKYEDPGSMAKMHDGKKFEDEGFMDSHFPSGKPRK